MKYIHYCPNCDKTFSEEGTQANCTTCGMPGTYLHMTSDEWETASTLEKDNAIKNATESKTSASGNIEHKIYREVTAMHKKITFMFVVTIISLILSISSLVVAFNYVKKINKTFSSFSSGFENSLDDLDDYDLDD